MLHNIGTEKVISLVIVVTVFAVHLAVQINIGWNVGIWGLRLRDVCGQGFFFFFNLIVKKKKKIYSTYRVNPTCALSSILSFCD